MNRSTIARQLEERAGVADTAGDRDLEQLLRSAANLLMIGPGVSHTEFTAPVSAPAAADDIASACVVRSGLINGTAHGYGHVPVLVLTFLAPDGTTICQPNLVCSPRELRDFQRLIGNQVDVAIRETIKANARSAKR